MYNNFPFYTRLPEELQTKILIITILASPPTAGRLSYLCKEWEKQVNNAATTKDLVEYMQKNNIDIYSLNTAERKKTYPSLTEITKLNQKLKIKRFLLTTIISGSPTLLATVIGCCLYAVSSDINCLLPIPITLFWIPFPSAYCRPYIAKMYPLLN